MIFPPTPQPDPALIDHLREPTARKPGKTHRGLLIVGLLNVLGAIAVAYYAWIVMHNLAGAIIAVAAFAIGCVCLVAAFMPELPKDTQ